MSYKQIHRTIVDRVDNKLVVHVMVEGRVDDVAAYGKQFSDSIDDRPLWELEKWVIAEGVKHTERAAEQIGFIIPEGKHYRR